jgi:RimJ/RimL family protein N-acetyltransferase
MARKALNWIVRERETQRMVGTVQATLRVAAGSVSAELAWVIGVAYQGRGHATEAVRAMVGWLRRRGVNGFAAHIHPGHGASERVAAHIGLVATDAVRDGEIRWAPASRAVCRSPCGTPQAEATISAPTIKACAKGKKCGES